LPSAIVFRIKKEGTSMEFLYVAGAVMMGALALKIGFVIYKNLFAGKKRRE
jgi:hypothetical protein